MTNTLHASRDTLHDIVITGLGCVTPAGSAVSEFWESLKNGNTGLKECDNGSVKYAGKCGSIEDKGIDRLVSMGVSAAREATRDASIDLHIMVTNMDKINSKYNVNIKIKNFIGQDVTT